MGENGKIFDKNDSFFGGLVRYDEFVSDGGAVISESTTMKMGGSQWSYTIRKLDRSLRG